MQAGKSTLIAIAFFTLSACGQPANNAAGTNDAAGAASEAKYQAAPELTGASIDRDGRVELVGRAAAGAAVRLSSPGAPAQFATADAGGIWRLTVPVSGAPRLFGLSMSAGGQVVQAMGYLFVAPGQIARLRVGGGTQVLASSAHSLAALALDYDNQRAATLSGFAPPGETVSLRADGIERGQATADQMGRFALLLGGPQPLTAGPHDFELVSPSGAVRFSANMSAPAQLSGTPFTAGRDGPAWRIDWITPGGGEQTTLIFDRAGDAA